MWQRWVVAGLGPSSDRAGESLVVFLLVARVMCALHSSAAVAIAPVSINYEKLGLLVLSVGAAAVDCGMVQSNLKIFKPRLNPSSGIFLGALTLPLLCCARVVQWVRDPTSDLEGIQAVRFQLWTAICCSLSMVLFSADLIGWHRKKSQHPLEEKTMPKGSNYVFPRLDVELSLPFAGFLLLSVLPRPQSGLGALGLGWALILAAGCKAGFQYILESFPGCATPGEAMLVAGGLVQYAGYASAYALGKIPIFRPLLKYGYGVSHGDLDVISAFLQVLVLGLLLLPWIFKGLVSAVTFGLNSTKLKGTGAADSALKLFGNSALFSLSFAFVVMFLIPLWLGTVRGLQQPPYLWVFAFWREELWQRGSLCVFWVIVMAISIFLIRKAADDVKVPRIIVRKYYHILVVILFTPGLLFQPEFMRLAFGIAFACFLVVEMVRVWRLPPFGDAVHHFMAAFTDSRDSDLLIVSHFTLLLGCALPLWLSTSRDHPVAPFAGILSLGIGDTVASMVGVKYGRIHLSKSNRKTVEGTLGGIVSMLLASLLLTAVLAKSMGGRQFVSMIAAVAGAGLLEAYTTQIDNAFVPLVLYSLLLL